MFKSLILSGVLISSVFGVYHENKPETVTENFIIDEIDSEGYVHGEIIPDENTQTGEGIYYSVEELQNAGLENIQLGDKVSITWTKEDYDNEEWEFFTAEEMD